MRTAPMVVREIHPKDPTEMRLVEHDHVVETLATRRPNHALHVRIPQNRPNLRGKVGEESDQKPEGWPTLLRTSMSRHAVSNTPPRVETGNPVRGTDDHTSELQSLAYLVCR